MDLKIDVLCPDCVKCQNAIRSITRALKLLGRQAKLNHVTNFREFKNFSVNVSQTPIIVINGQTEFAGKVPSVEIIQRKLAEYH